MSAMDYAAGDADILAGIADVARTHLSWSGPITRSMPLVETLDLDSIRLLTLIIELENRFRIRLDDQDEEAITTVGELVDVIRRKVDERDA